MLRLLFFVLFLQPFFAQANINATVYSVQQGNYFMVYADNEEHIPVSIEVSFDLKNMATGFGGTKKIFVVPPKTKKFELTKVTATKDRGRMSMNTNAKFVLGDFTKSSEDVVYDLPFEKGKQHEIYQGYNGRFSHRGKEALDFDLKIGDGVYASREGIVYKIEERNSRGCEDASCVKFNNYVIVYHEDGTFAEYIHLDRNGVDVNVGDRVERGQRLGSSGNTGWTSGPHLHFAVYRYGLDKIQYVKTRFRTGDRREEYLEEGKVYIRP